MSSTRLQSILDSHREEITDGLYMEFSNELMTLYREEKKQGQPNNQGGGFGEEAYHDLLDSHERLQNINAELRDMNNILKIKLASALDAIKKFKNGAVSFFSKPKPKSKSKPKVRCECGKEMLKGSLKRHMKTVSHRRGMGE